MASTLAKWKEIICSILVHNDRIIYDLFGAPFLSPSERMINIIKACCVGWPHFTLDVGLRRLAERACRHNVPLMTSADDDCITIGRTFLTSFKLDDRHTIDKFLMNCLLWLFALVHFH